MRLSHGRAVLMSSTVTSAGHVMAVQGNAKERFLPGRMVFEFARDPFKRAVRWGRSAWLCVHQVLTWRCAAAGCANTSNQGQGRLPRAR